MCKSAKCSFLIAYFFWAGLVGAGAYFAWTIEIDGEIREKIPLNDQGQKQSCYDSPLLNYYIFTKLDPFYKMQEMIEYWDCMGSDLYDTIKMYYISWNIGWQVLVHGFLAFTLRLAQYPWRYAIELVTFPFLFAVGEGIYIYVLTGRYQNDGVEAITDVHAQLCSSVGLIHWVLIAFTLLICIYGLTKACCRDCRDRQGDQNNITLRQTDRHTGRSVDMEMPGAAPGAARRGEGEPGDVY